MKILAALAATAVAAMVMPAAAAARPRIIAPPQVSGDPTVGSTLTATGYQYSGGDASWSWWRCQTEGRGDGCSPIPGAASTTYVGRPEDVGTRLRVRLLVEDGDQSARAISAPSDVVTQPPPPPPPVPTATPTPTPPEAGPPPPATTSPAPPTANPLAPTVPAGAVIGQEVARTLRMMRPAPVVRIRGYLTARGARVTLLTVSAPRGAAIAVSCRGRSCPLKKWAKATKVTRLLRFQRVLAAGTRLTIRVTKPGRIGKYTEIVIRTGKAPWRRDRCLKPGSSRPLRCPSA